MKKLLMALAIVCSVSALRAEADYYVALYAWAPGQLPTTASSTVCGLRATLVYGDCTIMDGLDLAIGANRTRERFNGLAIALCYNYANSAAGAQLGFANIVDYEFYGLQLGAWNHAGEGYGCQCGAVNTADYFAGLQLGLFNWANNFDGLQLGLLNWSNSLDGLQVGLVNVIEDQRHNVLPIVNFKF